MKRKENDLKQTGPWNYVPVQGVYAFFVWPEFLWFEVRRWGKKSLYQSTYLLSTRNTQVGQNCFGRLKRPCFGGLIFKNRRSLGLQVYVTQLYLCKHGCSNPFNSIKGSRIVLPGIFLSYIIINHIIYIIA